MYWVTHLLLQAAQFSVAFNDELNCFSTPPGTLHVARMLLVPV
jgi:hypothetical protein